MKSKTTAQKALTGTYKPSEARYTEQCVMDPATLDVPAHMASDPFVREFWAAHVDPLISAGALIATDAAALESVASLYSLYRKAAAQAATLDEVSYTTPNGTHALYPAVKLAMDLETKLIRALDTVGLTPARREKLQRPVTSEDADPMTDYLRVAK